ncbi:efflux RND transporter periplasmic adaptor subunit [Mucilaginibacter gotjawali]|uniref:Cobalt-zinc-cadmium efflux system membrane fusion protein n=2 Tax=Mucilaginibacter gotjawali TaxID=1550579 RepID=A0A839SIH0_9SPHI|nr:efflux RND transporter periplasmic adaptor subunit [Mucilaginibacter gotjawali]MBB3058065.1 cobalt-zinc-cadmium efflux system membrane fusion protein [Mucilaginibacter gotjawali]BAU52040.1 Cobalt-zinc-cadmium resistance protein CzcB [Mucilaginibacter gotjawali]
MTTYPYLKITTIAAAFIAAAVVLQSCHHAETPEKDSKFRVTDSFLSSLLVDTVQAASALSQITLTGNIAPDETKMVKIFPMVSGVAGIVKVQLGDVVQRGQTLATLRSPEMAGYTKDYISSAADVRNTRRILESTQDMYKGGLASQKDLEQAQSDYQKAVAESKRAGAVISINKSNENGYQVKAPIPGFLVEKNLTSNTQVRADNSQNLFTIADLSTVYVLVNVYESDISKIQTGDPVKITALSYPNKVFAGKIDKIDNMLDPDNKVMHARIKINNPGNLLKPGMFANILIKAKSAEELPFIDRNALVFDNDKNYAVVIDGKAKVHIQPVKVAKTVEDRAYISSGLKPGDKIVASRQVYLYESLKD